MKTMDISVPPAMKQFIVEQVPAGSYSTVSEYFCWLVREDQKRKAREEIDSELLESLDSGSATPWTPEDLEALKRRVRERHPHHPG